MSYPSANRFVFFTLAPNDILVDLAMRSFVGSRDIPKDHDTGMGLFYAAEKVAKTDKEKQDATTFRLLMEK